MALFIVPVVQVKKTGVRQTMVLHLATGHDNIPVVQFLPSG